MDTVAADKRIKEGLSLGDASALELLWDSHAEGLFAFAQGLLCSRHDAEDAAKVAPGKTSRDDINSYCILSRMLIPGIENVQMKGLAMIASARIAKLAIKAIQLKKSKGGFPRGLAEIGSGNEIIDPFTGKEFIYKPEGNAFSLYSVGINLKDDGGREAGKDDRKADDIVWRYQAN